MNPKVSVIIPIYNMGKYLVECLESVREQTLSNIEIIAINDGSTDDSLNILKKNAENDKRIIILDKENEGVGAARNDGLKVACGEFIAFMDPDDYYPDDKVLAKCYEAAKKNNVQVAGGYLRFVYPDGSYSDDSKKQEFNIIIKPEGLTEYKDYQYDFGYTCFLYSRELLTNNKVFFPLYSRFQDPPFFVNAMIAAERFYALDEPTYCYRADFNSGKTTPQKAIDFIKGISDNLNVSKEHNLVQLHYISTQRLDKEGSFMLSQNLSSDRISEISALYIKAISLVDTSWLMENDYDIPEYLIPEFFNYTISLAAKYEKIRNNKAIKLLKKLLRK